MKESQARFNNEEESVDCLFLLFFISAVDDRFNSFQVDVAKTVSPEVLESNSDITEIISIKVIINIFNSLIETREHPFVDER